MKNKLIELLEELEDYMHDRSDVDDNEGEYNSVRPNKEMMFLSEIQDALDELKK